MSNGYAKADLQEALDRAIEAYDAEVQRQADQWAKNHTESWRELRDLITKSLRRGEPITSDMVRIATRRSGGHSDTYGITFRPDVSLGRYYSNRGRRAYQIGIADLRSLKRALDAWTGDTVTDTTLSRMGYPGSVSIIFNAAERISEGYR